MRTYVQVGLILMVFMVAFGAPGLGNTWFQRAARGLSELARRSWLAVTLAGFTSLGISGLVSLFVQMPQPAIHDEFSYLLAADTFAHGRLTNPTHPMWVHFESIHIIHRPTYQSKYPPAQGLMLAAGQVLAGHPIVGAWLSTALACAIICWMLLAWLPPRWAVLGAFLAVLHPTTIGWSQCYWGGSVAMGGGALLLGAFRRLIQQPRAQYALLLGLGMAVLANSRPYEGMVLSLLLLPTLLARMMENDSTVRVLLRRVFLPISVVFALSAVAMGLYNQRVTGHAFQMPYIIHEVTYNAAPLFLWQAARPEPRYHHREMRNFYIGSAFHYYSDQRSVKNILSAAAHKLGALANGFFRLFLPTVYGVQQFPRKGVPIRPLQFALAVLLVTIPWLVRNQWVRFVLEIIGLFVAALLLGTWTLFHYAAPVASLVFLLLVQAMRYLCLWRWRGRPTGRFIVRVVLILYVVSAVIACSKIPQMCNTAWASQRERLLTRLKQDGERHLVFVRYGPEHSVHIEWVYNEADIDRAPVIWARAMDVDRDRELLEYFKDRRAWLLEADENPPRLAPYPGSSGLTEKFRGTARPSL